jgi:predicted phosphoribosyltransferase
MSTKERFTDRDDAGEQLAAELVDRGIDADLVLAIPRGGLPLGRAVADVLDAPLDIVVASKIGAPGNPEYAIGAVASDGSVWLDDDAIDRLGVSDAYVDREREAETEAAREKATKYRGGREAPDTTGKTVVVVDDGAATGSTALAAVRLVRASGAARIILAIPVAPPGTVADLEAVADTVVVLRTPSTFGAVGAFYERFDQVNDTEAMTYLDDED